MDIFKISGYASLMILFIVAARYVLINRFPKGTFTILWVITAIRLILPFSFKSKFSIYNILQFFMPVKNQSYAFYIDNMEISKVTSNVHINKFIFIWLLGVAVVGLYFIISYIRCIKEFKTSLPLPDNDFIKVWADKNKIIRNFDIRLSDKIVTPLTYGFLKPVILLPKCINLNNEIKLEYILEHELTHIKHFDVLWKYIFALAVILHWFNPIVWFMYLIANRDIELCCDETVVIKLGEHIKSSYAMSLINFEEIKNRFNPLCSNYNINSTEERIVAIMKMKKISILSSVLAFTFILGTSTAFATTAEKKSVAVKAKSVNLVVPDSNADVLNDTITFTTTVDSTDTTFNFDASKLEKYTIEEYEQCIKDTKEEFKNSDLDEKTKKSILDEMNTNLKNLKADNGKGEYFIYKPMKIGDNESISISVVPATEVIDAITISDK